MVQRKSGLAQKYLTSTLHKNLGAINNQT